MILEAKNISLQYGQERIIEAMDFKVETSEIISIIGPNGSGKSTLLKALGRLLKPSQGTVLLEGQDINRLEPQTVARKLAVLPQSAAAPPDMTVYDLVSYGRMPYQGMFAQRKAEDIAAVETALKQTGMFAKRHRPLGALSGGERQRAWLAMALSQQPQILLLDEPTTYLDIHHQLELMELVQTLHKTLKITVIMVLHDLNHAARFSKRLVAVKKGKIIADGTVKEVFTSDLLRRLYNIENSIIKIKEAGTEHLLCLPHSVAAAGA